MATLAAGVQRLGTNYLSTAFACTGSVFAVGTTIVFVRDSSGTLRSWQNGRSAFLNTLPGTNKDEVSAYTAFQILPSASITTDDNRFSFGTAIVSGGGGTAQTSWAVEARGLNNQLITGLSPSVAALKKESDNSTLSTVIIFTETTPGVYRFAFDPVANGEAFLRVDLGFTVPTQHRYVDIFLANTTKPGSKAYVFEAKDSNGNHVSGIIPTVLSFKKESDGSNISATLTFTETVTGLYKFYYNPVTGGTALLQLNLGATVSSDNRIVNFQLN